MTIQIKIPFKTPSVNHLYFNWNNIRILTKEAKDLKLKINEAIKSQHINVGDLIDKELKIVIEIHGSWYTKKNTVRKADISNKEKFLVDSVFQYLELDDKFIFNHKMIKVQDTEEYSLIKIKVIEDVPNKTKI